MCKENHSNGTIPTQQEERIFKNPIIWTDIPDPDVIRVNDVYYMTSTTMYYNPGVPIMKSYDLLNWEIVNYVYDILADNEEQILSSGKNEYGKGSWASSIRYHHNTFYVTFGSLATGKTYIYQTNDIEKGPWTSSVLDEYYHDMSLLFDDDGHVYMVYGNHDIKVIELTADATAIKEGGLNKVIIPQASLVASPKEEVGLPAEGAHIQKINGMYYVFTITWPKNRNRTQLVHRSEKIDGEYEGRVAFNHKGIAQGGIIDTINGEWYGLLFQDSGALGRIPYLIPITWENQWPIFGEQDSSLKKMMSRDGRVSGKQYVVDSDEFDLTTSSSKGFSDGDCHKLLKVVWQWNHNPDHRFWSLTDRPGFLRLTTGNTCKNIEEARNTLTQRTMGPECSAKVALEITNMKDGDLAGFAAFQKDYGFVGVRKSGDTCFIVMINNSLGDGKEIESIPVNQDRVHFKIYVDYRDQVDKAYFYYSLDGEKWNSIGNILQMKYKLDHFVGYRFALFNYATKLPGGFVDFDYFRLDE
ncbi:glycoside hydrolase 43 family protein [Bacillus sp. J37]|uniref:glycoside hydrolase family 43 protein n=1 Tax=Bacillus sp. J37 TaxID=935837 RepID=UPI0004B00195|nr:glycoside hydrolase 43 family protein [Bacillus sp. J37]